PGARVVGIGAGLFVLVEFRVAVSEEAVVSAAAARGVGVEGLAWHRFAAGELASAGLPGPAGPPGPPGLVLGFANMAQAAIERGVRELGEAVREVGG
ncbi:MAG TPA: hypothetical protein VGF93_16460, partial [Solirubrobacteraceae bacterium]